MVEPAVPGDRHVDERRDAGEQEFRIGDGGAGRDPRRVAAEERHELVERRLVELRRAELVVPALRHRLRGGVRVDIDEARHDEAPGAVDHGLRRPLVAAADLDDLRAVEGEVLVLQIDMAAALLVVGDDPGGVPDEGDRHLAFAPEEGVEAAPVAPPPVQVSARELQVEALVEARPVDVVRLEGGEPR